MAAIKEISRATLACEIAEEMWERWASQPVIEDGSFRRLDPRTIHDIPHQKRDRLWELANQAVEFLDDTK
ncbi:MAG: hypothetical protein AAFR11_05725 [Pseudomonadota bacterium]